MKITTFELKIPQDVGELVHLIIMYHLKKMTSQPEPVQFHVQTMNTETSMIKIVTSAQRTLKTVINAPMTL